MDSTSGQICYRAVVAVPGVPAAELFRRARGWFASNFPGYKEVVSVEDPVAGEMVGTYGSVLDKYVLLTYNGYVIYRTLHVTVKEGRYRYELTNFRQRNLRYNNQFYGVDPKNAGDLRRFGPEITRQAQQNIASLGTAMNPPTGTANKQDW